MLSGSGTHLVHASLVIDGMGRRFAPGALLVRDGTVIGAGSPQMIGEVDKIDALVLSSRVLIPALVNGHTHLDLTHIGPMRFGGSFTEWVGAIRGGRARDDDAIVASVRRGIALSRAGGTAIVGDIAGVSSLTPTRALRRFRMMGVSFIEVFGIGRGEHLAELKMREAIEQCAHDEGGVRIGLQPHAPYSCSLSVYRAAVELAAAHHLPLATHLAETQEEIRFIRTADGPIAQMLREIGVWEHRDAPRGVSSAAANGASWDHSADHPIDLLAPALSSAPFLAAHLNYVDDAHIDIISRWPISVAYCPRASTYFGHPVHHRYRDMIEAGINVTLGTDSIVCLDTPDRISVLDEMRFLYRRDATDPQTLLRMGTVAGAKALGFDPDLVTFREGPIAGVLALPCEPDDDVDPFVSALMRSDPPEWVLRP